MKIRNIIVVFMAMFLLCAPVIAEAAKLAPYGPFRALDDDANPLTGGKLFTYEAGTTTPKPSYTDASGTVANSNPVVLDAAGYGNVWLADGAYKFVLKDANDVTLWTIDNVAGDSSAAFGSQVVVSPSNLAITDVYANAVVIATATQTHTLPPAAEVGSGFYYVVKNDSASGILTIDPDGSETIDGASTLTIPAGVGGLIITDGSVWYSDFVNAKSAASAATIASDVITNLPAKTSIVAADQIAIADSADSNTNKKITFANFKTSLAAITNVSVRTFTTSGTYTPTAGTAFAKVEIIGGGGAGGGAQATVAGQCSNGAGGGGGGYSSKLLSAADIGASKSFTLGAGGTGVSGAAGGDGGDSSFGSILSAAGGDGGTAVLFIGTAIQSSGGGGGNAAGGDVNIAGQSGGSGYCFAATSLVIGAGASTTLGTGGTSTVYASPGKTATGYGAGGGGAGNSASLAAQAGGNGAPGYLIVTEYIRQ